MWRMPWQALCGRPYPLSVCAWSTSAPLWSNSFTTSPCPLVAATCSGPPPQSVRAMFTSAPDRRAR